MIGLKITLKSGAQVRCKCEWADSIDGIPMFGDTLKFYGEDPLDSLWVRTPEIAAIEVTSYTYKAK